MMQKRFSNPTHVNLGDLWRFSPPQLPDPLVQKPRLLSEIIADKQPVAIIAPSGYGKTTLAAQLFSHWQGTHVWASFAEMELAMADLARTLVTAFHHALEFDLALMHRIKEGLVDDPRSLIELVITELQRHPTPTLLVLDNLTQLKSGELSEAIDRMLQAWPSQHKLVITSGSAHWLNLISPESRGKLSISDAEQLKFDRNELIQLLGDNLSPALQELALPFIEGSPALAWIIRNAQLSQQDLTDINSTEELVSRCQQKITAALPKDEKQFLLASSLTDYFNLTLVEQMLQQDCQALLPRLLKQQLLQGTNSDPSWFHFHKLWRFQFRQNLISQDPELARTLVRRAADWWMQHQQPRQAIYLAKTINDVALMQRLVAEHGWLMYQRGQHQLLKQTIELIPSSQRAKDPALLMVAAKVFLIDDMPASKLFLDQLETHIDGDGEASRAIQVSHACLRSTYALKAFDLPLLRKYARTAYELAPIAPDILTPSAYAALAELLWVEGEIDKARYLWLGALQEAKQRGYVVDQLWQAHFVATTFFYQGKPEAVREFYEEAHDAAQQHQLRYTDSLWCIYRTESEIALLRGDWQEAKRCNDQAMHITRNWPEEAQLPCLVLKALHHKATHGPDAEFDRQLETIEYLTYQYEHHPFVLCRAHQLLLSWWNSKGASGKIQDWLSLQLSQIHSQTLFDIHYRRNVAAAHFYCSNVEAAEELAEQAATLASSFTAAAESLSSHLLWLLCQDELSRSEINQFLERLSQQQRLGEIKLYCELYRPLLQHLSPSDDAYRLIMGRLPKS
ncbi:AAA family ATPase [Corallincola platygyrae]|uniref:AAA family ATPase n=1 Tax=Corallincola platygyrae TaxID=1193278 RepID=A0ABW4XRE9_9GAMM